MTPTILPRIIYSVKDLRILSGVQGGGSRQNIVYSQGFPSDPLLSLVVDLSYGRLTLFESLP